MTLLCKDVDQHEGYVRKESIINAAKDISQASSVNKELYAASLPAFNNLSQLCCPLTELVPNARRVKPNRRRRRGVYWYGMQPEEPEIPIPEANLWNEFVTDPLGPKACELQSLCVALGLHKTNPKAVMAHDIMQQIGLKHATRVPACLVLTVVPPNRRMSYRYWPARSTWYNRNIDYHQYTSTQSNMYFSDFFLRQQHEGVMTFCHVPTIGEALILLSDLLNKLELPVVLVDKVGAIFVWPFLFRERPWQKPTGSAAKMLCRNELKHSDILLNCLNMLVKDNFVFTATWTSVVVYLFSPSTIFTWDVLAVWWWLLTS